MFLLQADISENGFYTIFWIFIRSVTKLEDADEIRSIDGNINLSITKGSLLLFFQFRIHLINLYIS